MLGPQCRFLHVSNSLTNILQYIESRKTSQVSLTVSALSVAAMNGRITDETRSRRYLLSMTASSQTVNKDRGVEYDNATHRVLRNGVSRRA